MAGVAHPISPELVLVSPDLREELTNHAAPDPDTLFGDAAPPQPRPALVAPPPLPVALAAYVVEALLLGAVRGAAMIAAIAAAAFVLAR